ncbi:MAG: CHASE domain-containing protein, partial [Oceanococcaceae bacterium]
MSLTFKHGRGSSTMLNANVYLLGVARMLAPPDEAPRWQLSITGGVLISVLAFIELAILPVGDFGVAPPMALPLVMALGVYHGFLGRFVGPVALAGAMAVSHQLGYVPHLHMAVGFWLLGTVAATLMAGQVIRYVGRSPRRSSREMMQAVLGRRITRVLLLVSLSTCQWLLTKELHPPRLSAAEMLLIQTGANALGFYIYLHLAMVLFARPRRLWVRHGARLAVVCAAVLFLVSLLAITEVRPTAAVEQQIAQQDADRLARFLDDELERSTLALVALRAFYQASTNVDRSEFGTFASAILRDRAALAGLSWVPIVDAGELDQFEARQRQQERGASFFVWERSKANTQPVPVSERPIYFPVTWIVPTATQENAIGFDLASEARRRDALQRAMNDPDHVFATEVLHLVQDDLPAPAYLEAISVPEHGGMLTAVVRLREALDNVFRLDPEWASSLIYTLRNERGEVFLSAGHELFDVQRSVAGRAQFLMNDQQGELTVYRSRFDPAPESLSNPLWKYLMALFFGASICSAMGGQAHGLAESNRRFRQNLSGQRRLRRTEQQLHDSERLATLGGLVAGITHEVNSPLQTALLTLESMEPRLQTLNAGPMDGRNDTFTRVEKMRQRALNNLRRANELMSRFKRTARDVHDD